MIWVRYGGIDGMNAWFWAKMVLVGVIVVALTVGAIGRGRVNPGVLGWITRLSLLQIAQDLGYEVAEGRISVDDWKAGNDNGTLTEVFACGTAAVITPVGAVKSESANWTVADGAPGPVTTRLREELIAIQYGHRPDPFSWTHKVC